MPGTFTLRPIQANLTHDTDWLGKMDPYCSYRIGASRVKGPICKNGGKFPKWEDAAVNLPAPDEPSMVVDLLDKDKLLFDDTIGSFVIDLQEVQSKGQLSKWYPVYWRQKPAGEILLEAAYQPDYNQQSGFVQEPVMTKVVQEPIIVEKVVQEEVIQPQKVDGPIIEGISQIHHGGQGYGLVRKHGPILGEGVQGSTLQQSTVYHQGPYPISSGLQQGALYQGELNQGGLNQGNFGQGGLNQGKFNQEGFNQGNFGQGGLNQGNLNQGNF